MKKQILLFVLMLLPMVVSADEAVVDGIKYNIVTRKHIAEVISYSYSGGIVIPETIEYEGVTCNVTSIGENAFSNCRNLTSITIPNSVTWIGSGAFAGCSSLTSVIIPNSVTSIEEIAFYRCSSLTSVTIGTSVTSIGVGAFSSCSSLTSVIIPNSVTSIGNQAFYDCSNLTSVYIGNSVITIGPSAFNNCSKLTSINIPNSVTTIWGDAFKGCRNLTTITIPNSVTSIRYNTFSGCSSLTSVTIGNSVTSIENGAFAECAELTDFYCYSENIPSTYSNAFENSEIGYATLHVPDASVENYRRTSPWSEFGTIVGLEGGETPKCAKPTIYYSQGKLSFACETEGVEFVSEIKDADIKKNYESEVQLSVTYNISVYAIKSGYEDSEVAEATLCWIEVDPQKEGITEETATEAKQMKAMPVLIQAADGQISVEGAPEGTKVEVYDASGVEVGAAISRGGTTLIPTRLASGSIAIVKIGEKAVKLAVK